MKTVDENCKQKAAQQPITYPSNEPIWDAFFRYVHTETKEISEEKPLRKQKELVAATA